MNANRDGEEGKGAKSQAGKAEQLTQIRRAEKPSAKSAKE